jgi:hypothetical protein
MKLLLFVSMIGYLSVASVHAQPVGETHRVTSERTASLRDAQHRDLLRITVWYSAAADAVEGPVVEGPPAQPLFDIGAVAPNAPFATDNIRQPVLLLSHGFGGTALITGWFGIAMALARAEALRPARGRSWRELSLALTSERPWRSALDKPHNKRDCMKVGIQAYGAPTQC